MDEIINESAQEIERAEREYVEEVEPRGEIEKPDMTIERLNVPRLMNWIYTGHPEGNWFTKNDNQF